MSNITVEYTCHIRSDRHGRQRLVSGEAPEPPAPVEPGRTPRITKLMALAIRFEEKIEQGHVRDMAQLARLGHVSRARLTQIMNLRLLAPDIQEALLHLPRVLEGRSPIKYGDIVPIIQCPLWRNQRTLWQELLARRGVTPPSTIQPHSLVQNGGCSL